jgi:acyl-coenzyme A synthetase/AMP-(fatty) acid ligase
VRALIVNESGAQRAVGAAELDQLTDRVAAGLADSGVTVGDVVLVRLGKSLDWLVAMRALWRLGAVSLPCPELLTEGDLADRMSRSGAVRALLEPADLPASDDAPPAPALASSDPGFLLFTSGTEGGPKGALHRRGYVDANRLQTERWMGVRAGDRVWCTAATGWSKSLRNAWLAAELAGAETVLHAGRFDAGERLELIGVVAPDVLCMSPTEYRRCAAVSEFASADLSSVREAVAAGEALDAPTVELWREVHGIAVRDGYGQTETGAVAGVLAGEQPVPGSLGRPLPGVGVRIADGELCVVASTLPTLFLGYLDDREATGRSLRHGLWHTGDLVREDEDGRLWYDGRRDDVISSSGYRIGPGEVESALRSHPAVAEAAAVGLPDRDRGQIVHADVVLSAGTVPSDELADRLRTHVREATAPYKYPRSLRFVEELPRTSTGKVRRAAIRADLAHG